METDSAKVETMLTQDLKQAARWYSRGVEFYEKQNRTYDFKQAYDIGKAMCIFDDVVAEMDKK